MPPEEASKARARKVTKELPPTIDMFLKCPKCQHPQNTYVYNLNDKPWIKCDACDTLSPSGAWGVIAIGSYLTSQ